MSNVLHYNAIRMRVVGSGTLHSTLSGYDSIPSEDLADLTLSTTNFAEQTRLANFISQRAKIRVSVNTINDWFKFNTIIIYAKPIYSSYPDN